MATLIMPLVQQSLAAVEVACLAVVSVAIVVPPELDSTEVLLGALDMTALEHLEQLVAQVAVPVHQVVAQAGPVDRVAATMVVAVAQVALSLSGKIKDNK
jgi:hypothetical protein